MRRRWVPATRAMPEAGAHLYRMLNPLIARFGFRFQFCRTFLENIVRSYTHNVLNVVFFQDGLNFRRCPFPHRRGDAVWIWESDVATAEQFASDLRRRSWRYH